MFRSPHLFFHFSLLLLNFHLTRTKSSATTSPGSWHHHHVGHKHAAHDCTAGDCINGASTKHFHRFGPYQGHYQDGHIVTGRGVDLLDRGGHFYRGHFKDSKWHGLGVLHKGTTTYHGRWSNGVLSGPVETTLRNGTVWLAHFSKNSTPWIGQTRWPWCVDATVVNCLDHGMYLGRWFRGQPNGFGIFANGTHRYEGDWASGTFAGHGIYQTTSFRYDGNFQLGEMHGEGVYYDLVAHTKFSGEFQHGKREGVGFLKTPGFLWGFQIKKNIWRNGTQMMDLPHDEL